MSVSDPVRIEGELPPGSNVIGSVSVVPGSFSALGGERLTMAGAAQPATIPVGTNLIRLAAEGGDLRYSFSGAATSSSPGYLPAGVVEYIRHIGSLSVYGPSGAFANLIYFEAQ